VSFLTQSLRKTIKDAVFLKVSIKKDRDTFLHELFGYIPAWVGFEHLSGSVVILFFRGSSKEKCERGTTRSLLEPVESEGESLRERHQMRG